MKYAIISDIHGNMPALKLVLEDARKQGADAFLFAGDYCVSAPWFNEVVACMRSLTNARFICGNEEHYLHIPDGDDGQFAVSRWAARSMQPDHVKWLDALPERLDWECEGISLHMAHKSQTFIDQAESGPFSADLLPKRYSGKITRDFLLSDIRSTLAKDAVFQKLLETLPYGVYIFGHTHCQWHARFGNHLFINPGSCGLPLDCGLFGAPYTLLTIESGQCAVEERRVSYDVEELIASVKRTEQYEAASVWSEVIFTEWRACRERVIYFLYHMEKYARIISDPRRPFMPDTWEAGFEDWMSNGEKP